MKRLASLGALLLFFSLGCSTYYAPRDIPPQVVDWAQTNVWKVKDTANGKRGSSFWVTDKTLVTACHVVSDKLVEATYYVENTRLGKKASVEVLSCKEDTDIAVLQVTEDPEFKPDVTRIAQDAPKQGTAVYGAGFPHTKPLTITFGHWQQKLKGRPAHLITSPTIGGDSGSPSLIFKDGKVIVAGIRLSILAFGGMSPYQPPSFITHIVAVGGSSEVLKELKAAGKGTRDG